MPNQTSPPYPRALHTGHLFTPHPTNSKPSSLGLRLCIGDTGDDGISRWDRMCGRRNQGRMYPDICSIVGLKGVFELRLIKTRFDADAER